MSLTKAISAGARRPEAIGVERENDEGGDERQFTGQSHRLDRHAHADQLQGDMARHGRDHARHRNGQFEPSRIVGAVDDIGRGDMAVGMRNLPQHRHDREHEGIDDDGVRQREETVGADRIDQRRHRDHGVADVEIHRRPEPR